LSQFLIEEGDYFGGQSSIMRRFEDEGEETIIADVDVGIKSGGNDHQIIHDDEN
jgi:hypothetical protein